MQEIVYHTNYQIESYYWWFVARNKIINKLIKKYILYDKNVNLLDVGCGTGGFAGFISKFFNVVCLDTSELALTYCRKRGLENLFNGTLEDYSKQNHNISLITMLDVIEHIENDKEAVLNAFKILNSGGFLIATVPAYQWLWSKHDQIHMHQRRYTKKEFKNLLKDAGFNIQFCTYFNSILFPVVAFIRTYEKIFKIQKNDNSPVDEVSPLINKLLEKIFSFEGNLLQFMKFPYGLSILIIAKKD